MEHCRLYIADVDKSFIAGVRSAMSHCPRIDVVGSSGDGRQSLRDIARLNPDVAMTEFCLPGLDGISLLRETRRLKRPPSVIVCTRMCTEASMLCATRYGAAFFLCKPVDLQNLPFLILECAKYASLSTGREKRMNPEDSKHDRAVAVRDLFRELGISPKLDGCAYIQEAAVYFHDDELLLKNLSRGLYAEIADRMDTTVSRIERSIRSAIVIGYERGALSRYFSHRPTNRQFIEFIMCRIGQDERRYASISSFSLTNSFK